MVGALTLTKTSIIIIHSQLEKFNTPILTTISIAIAGFNLSGRKNYQVLRGNGTVYNCGAKNAEDPLNRAFLDPKLLYQ